MDVHNWLMWMCYGGWIFAISMIVTLTHRLNMLADYVKHLEERLTFCCRDINKYREEVLAYKAIDHAAQITFAEMQRQNEESSLSKKKRG